MKVATYFENRIKSDSRFELMTPRQSLTVCFRYVSQNGADIDNFNIGLREALRKSGRSIVNFGYIDGEFTYRWVVTNAEVTTGDVDIFIENMTSLAVRLDQGSTTFGKKKRHYHTSSGAPVAR